MKKGGFWDQLLHGSGDKTSSRQQELQQKRQELEQKRQEIRNRIKNGQQGPLKMETHKVAGTSHRQEALRALGVKNKAFDVSRKDFLRSGKIGDCLYEYIFQTRPAELVPEPDNPYDSKAIKVIVGGTHIGYIKEGSCAHIHNLLRDGRVESVTCSFGGGGRKTLVEDDLDDTKPSVSEDYIPFYARLEITVKPEN